MVSERLLAFDFKLLPAVPLPGLLAGLYEFPAFVDVSKNQSPEKLTAEILSKLQINKSHLTRTATHSVGDVQHIFSHIKKTYRAQWIVLESNTEPPPPVYFDGAEILLSKKHKSKKDSSAPDGSTTNTRWVTLKEVDDMKLVSSFLVSSPFLPPSHNELQYGDRNCQSMEFDEEDVGVNSGFLSPSGISCGYLHLC